MVLPDIDELRSRLVGRRFSPGRTTIRAFELGIGNDAMSAPRGADEPGPLWSLIAGYRGMDTTIDELARLAEAPPDSHITLGELSTRHLRPLRPEVDYTVECELLDVARKTGTRSGIFDILTFEVRVLENGQELASSVRSSFIVPRDVT